MSKKKTAVVQKKAAVAAKTGAATKKAVAAAPGKEAEALLPKVAAVLVQSAVAPHQALRPHRLLTATGWNRLQARARAMEKAELKK